MSAKRNGKTTFYGRSGRIVTNDGIHFSNLDSDGEQSSHDTSDTDYGCRDGSSSEESSLDEAIVHIAIEPNNDIDDSATDITTNEDSRTITGKNSILCRKRKDDEREPLILSINYKEDMVGLGLEVECFANLFGELIVGVLQNDP